MQSHELSHALLAMPDRPLLFQVAHEVEVLDSGALLPAVIDISESGQGRGLPTIICIEVGDPDHPAMNE